MASPEVAEQTHFFIRNWVFDNVSAVVAAKLRIQYGGSVKGSNAADLISQPNIDGFLVGGAALKPEFADIVTAANQIAVSQAVQAREQIVNKVAQRAKPILRQVDARATAHGKQR